MARLTLLDTARLAGRGLRGRPLRFALSAFGIGIGVAAMVAVAGITQSSKVELNNLLSRLGTNLLRVYPTPDLQGTPTRLPASAPEMLGNIAPVTGSSSVAELTGVGAYRSPYVPSGHTNSLVVSAVQPSLRTTLRANLGSGHWFTAADQAFPVVVLGHSAAQRLDVHTPGDRIWVDHQWCVVIGILRPVPLAPGLDATVLITDRAAQDYFGYDGTSTAVYLRADEHQVVAVSAVVPQTASPQHPDQVGIDRPSDALTAQLTADKTLDHLLIGLAAVGLLVGGIGVSNTMIIAVIERRSEIGLRRALGATRGNIAAQFLAEATLMATAGGTLGVILGYVVTAAYASTQGWPTSLPLLVGVAAILLTAAVGAIAGLYPALRAGNEPPASALSVA